MIFRNLLNVSLLAAGILLGGLALPRAAAACETAGNPFVVVVDRETRLGQIAPYAVGDTTTYSINCAPANSPIYWSSTKNGVSTGEVNAYYGQNTDANGHWSASASSPWTSASLGHWTKTAKVGTNSVVVAFDVTPKLTVNSFVSSINGVPTATVGQSTTYTITGAPPNTAIYWSSTRNNASTGEVNAYYGQTTDASGNWSATAGSPWTTAQVGGWVKTATFGNPSSPTAPNAAVDFQVISSCEIFSPSSGTTASNSFSSHAGAYDWPNNRCLVDDGADQMAALGAHVARILFSANCSPQESLVSVLNAPELQEAIANPNLTTIILTVFDQSTCGNNAKIYVDPSLYPNSSVVTDYQNLTEQLYSQYHGSGKTFIIDNWEGDNAVYCGYAYGYATDAPTRAACDANYAVSYKGVANVSSGISGFTAWASARQQGVAAGKSWAVSQGLTAGIQVDYAIEFNIVHALQNAGYPSVLNNTLPSVAHDYASYSAYESTNVSAAQLQTDLNYLRDSVLHTSNILIGEFGFSEQAFTQQQVRQKSDAILNTAISWGVPYIIQWVVFDNDDYGLYDFAASPQAMACYYQSRLAGGTYPTGTCN
jgi:hypothetical protein